MPTGDHNDLHYNQKAAKFPIYKQHKSSDISWFEQSPNCYLCCMKAYKTVVEISQLDFEVWCSEILPGAPLNARESVWKKYITDKAK